MNLLNFQWNLWLHCLKSCFWLQQDGAASESSSSRGRIVRKFSCQEIRHWSLDFGHWILELRHWTLELVHWTLKCCNSVVMLWKYSDRNVMWFDSIVFDSIDQFGLVFLWQSKSPTFHHNCNTIWLLSSYIFRLCRVNHLQTD